MADHAWPVEGCPGVTEGESWRADQNQNRVTVLRALTAAAEDFSALTVSNGEWHCHEDVGYATTEEMSFMMQVICQSSLFSTGAVMGSSLVRSLLQLLLFNMLESI